MIIRSQSLTAGASTRNVRHRTIQTPTKSLRRSYRRLNKKSQKRLVRFSIVTANLLLIVSVASAIAQVPSSASGSHNSESAQALLASDPKTEAKPLDKLASTDVAVHVSRLVGMEESTAVTNKADTASAQMAVSSSDDQVLSKPQIVTTSLKSKKDIKYYVVASGDTVSSIAAKFGVSPDTIRFSNGLNGETVDLGKKLIISPVNGMTYTVQAGDTPDTLAAKYNVPKEQLVAFNDAEVSGAFKTGELIVIPDAIQPAAVRTASYGGRSAAASGGSAVGGFSFGNTALYGGNGYDYGWCTWHAANRRIQNGNPLPKNLGNAVSWLPLARKAGLATGDVPRTGAVLYHKDIGGLGHVAYVERVNPDGSAFISDMNYPTWGKVTYRTIQPDPSRYAFIY
jgi:surface antigen/LysM repeat protein